MAIRTKTIEYAFGPTSASVASGVARAFPQLMVYIPETGSRSFKSCFITTWVADYLPNASVASVTAWRLQAAVGSGVGDTTGEGAAISHTITNSGENQWLIFSRDVTPLFNTSFGAGLSQSMNVTMSITGLVTCNAHAKAYITYEYEDTSAPTRIKTVRIPLESHSGSLTNALREYNPKNQIPALDTYLPEVGKVYRDVFFEFYGNETQNGTTGCSLAYSLDGAGETRWMAPPGTVSNVGRTFYLNSKRLDMATNVQHAISLRSSASVTGGTFDCVAPVLNVTYEYSHLNSSRSMNSIIIPAADQTGYIGGTTVNLKNNFSRTFNIQEPGSISLAQSAVQYSFADAGTVTLITSAGGQVAKTYTVTPALIAGGWILQHRIDSGSTSGAGITLNRGWNTASVNFYRTSNAAGSMASSFSALMYLNYTSDISSQPGGDANHAQTRMMFLSKVTGSAQIRDCTSGSTAYTQSIAPIINATNYWVVGAGYHIYSFLGGTVQNVNGLAMTMYINPSEGGPDWVDIYANIFTSDGELGVLQSVGRGLDYFKKYPEYPKTDRFNLEIPRLYRMHSSVALAYHHIHSFYTYNTIHYDVSGTLSNYVSTGGGIPVKMYRDDTNEHILSFTTAPGGLFSGSWYDNTIPLYAEAYQNTTHLGRSGIFTASGAS